jgi:Protein of unknown function (DUF1579)
MKVTFAAVVAVLLAGVSLAQDAPKPHQGHEFLKQLEGEWTSECEAVMEPGKPPSKWTGTESTRSLGGFWAVSEMKGDAMGVPMTGLMTVGYDPAKKKYVGTWVCSMCDTLFHYEGTLDTAGKVLTLNTEGPNPATGKTVKMRDVIEIKDKNTRVLTSEMLGEDGKWTKFMSITATRKK